MEDDYKRFILILLISLSIYSYPVINSYKEGNTIEKEIKLSSDLYWHFNTIKYVANTWNLPREVQTNSDAGINGDLSKENIRSMFHSPLYYFLGGFVYNLSPGKGLLLLEFLSVVLMICANIFFFLSLKKISNYFENEKSFVTYSLIIFAFLPVHLYHSGFIHNDIMYYFVYSLIFYFFIRFAVNKNKKNAIIFGVFAGLGLLSRLSAIAIFIALAIYIIFKYFNRKYNEAKLLSYSLLTAIVIGGGVLIRNKILFDSPFGDITSYFKERELFSGLAHLARGFWGGVYGGEEKIFFLVGLASITLIITTLVGIKKFYNNSDKINLNFLLLVPLVQFGLTVLLGCDPVYLIKNGVCFGTQSAGRYFIPLDPIIAISSGLVFSQIKKRMIPLIVIGISMIFILDFLAAF